MATNKVQTGLRLSEPLYQKIKALAEMEQRSLNNLIEYGMQKYIEDYERQNGPIQPLPED